MPILRILWQTRVVFDVKLKQGKIVTFLERNPPSNDIA